MSVREQIKPSLTAVSYLDTAVLLPTKLNFAELALTDGVAEDEISKLGIALVRTIAVVVPAASCSPIIIGWAHVDSRGGCSGSSLSLNWRRLSALSVRILGMSDGLD